MIPHVAMAFISAALLTAAIVLRTAAMGWWWLRHPSVVWALLTGAVALPLWNLAQLLPLDGSVFSPVKIAVFLALVAAEALVILLPGTRWRRQQLQVAKRLDDRARPIWTSVASRLTEYDAPGWVRLHFEGAEQAIGRRDGRQAIAELRHGTVRMAIALRPLTRAYPADPDLAAALTATLAVRDQAVAEASSYNR
ncbi:hypothetical protein GZL_p00048 (plasmid) [Streptomyces sp. 769]|nr:hypothetical protein GZL_p00048 [Streptomyces sp. 769]